MIVKIIRATIAQKKQVMPGAILEVSQEEGIQLISAGKAIAIKEQGMETADQPLAEAKETEIKERPKSVNKSSKRRSTKKASAQ